MCPSTRRREDTEENEGSKRVRITKGGSSSEIDEECDKNISQGSSSSSSSAGAQDKSSSSAGAQDKHDKVEDGDNINEDGDIQNPQKTLSSSNAYSG